MVPVSPLPELSETVLPAPSLKEYALTSPAGGEEGWRVREVLWAVPLSDAEMVTDCEVVTVQVETAAEARVVGEQARPVRSTGFSGNVVAVVPVDCAETFPAASNAATV